MECMLRAVHVESIDPCQSLYSPPPALYSPPPALYSPPPALFLRHVLPGMQGNNIWMLRQLARLREVQGKQAKADELRGYAATMSNETITNMYSSQVQHSSASLLPLSSTYHRSRAYRQAFYVCWHCSPTPTGWQGMVQHPMARRRQHFQAITPRVRTASRCGFL
jgi:hypothetical protein